MKVSIYVLFQRKKLVHISNHSSNIQFLDYWIKHLFIAQMFNDKGAMSVGDLKKTSKLMILSDLVKFLN